MIFHTKYPKNFILSAPPLTWNPGSAPVTTAKKVYNSDQQRKTWKTEDAISYFQNIIFYYITLYMLKSNVMYNYRYLFIWTVKVTKILPLCSQWVWHQYFQHKKHDRWLIKPKLSVTVFFSKWLKLIFIKRKYVSK